MGFGYGWKDVPALIMTPPGREAVAATVRYVFWPVMWLLGWLYRRVVVRRAFLIAVTGSFGKTTTTSIIAQALGGCPHFIFYNHTTRLSRNLLSLPIAGGKAVMEVGAGAGHMAGQAGMLKPQIAVVTSIGSEHNTKYKTLEAVRSEKAKLVRALTEDGLAVLNGDDSNVLWMAGETAAKVITFGFGEHNDIRADNYRLDWPRGSRFSLRLGSESREVEFGLLGRHMVYAGLAAIAVGLNQGISLEQLLENLKTATPIRARMQVCELSNGAWMIRDEYKSTLETIDASLLFFRELPVRRKLLVIGSISEVTGNQHQQYKRVGRLAAEAAIQVLYVGTSFKSLKSGFRQKNRDPRALTYCRGGVKEAIAILQHELGPGDVVLIKGRTSQHLARVALGLMGKKVRCDIKLCRTVAIDCDDCAILEKGWNFPAPR